MYMYVSIHVPIPPSPTGCSPKEAVMRGGAKLSFSRTEWGSACPSRVSDFGHIVGLQTSLFLSFGIMASVVSITAYYFFSGPDSTPRHSVLCVRGVDTGNVGFPNVPLTSRYHNSCVS